MDRDPAARRPVLTDHYADPAYYDQSYADRIDDVAFYVERALRASGPVLEYGVGTGRIAIPIARHGREVVGVDSAAPMLRWCRRRLARERDEVRRRVTLRAGDWGRVRLGRFALVICPFNGVLHLYDTKDAARFFSRVRAHLGKNGLFVCDLNVPSLMDLARDKDKPYRVPSFVHPTAGAVRYSEYFDYDMSTQILTVRMRFEPKRGQAFEQVLLHRQFFPKEWEALLWHNGLELVERWGDFHHTPFDRDSDQLVCLAKRRRGWT